MQGVLAQFCLECWRSYTEKMAAGREEERRQKAAIDAALEQLQLQEKAEIDAYNARINDEIAAGQRGPKRSLFPKLWQRLRNKVVEDDGDSPAPLPTKSGANITLEDLAKRCDVLAAAIPHCGATASLAAWQLLLTPHLSAGGMNCPFDNHPSTRYLRM